MFLHEILNTNESTTSFLGATSDQQYIDNQSRVPYKIPLFQSQIHKDNVNRVYMGFEIQIESRGEKKKYERIPVWSGSYIYFSSTITYSQLVSCVKWPAKRKWTLLNKISEIGLRRIWEPDYRFAKCRRQLINKHLCIHSIFFAIVILIR